MCKTLLCRSPVYKGIKLEEFFFERTEDVYNGYKDEFLLLLLLCKWTLTCQLHAPGIPMNLKLHLLSEILQFAFQICFNFLQSHMSTQFRLLLLPFNLVLMCVLRFRLLFKTLCLRFIPACALLSNNIYRICDFILFFCDTPNTESLLQVP